MAVDLQPTEAMANLVLRVVTTQALQDKVK